MDLFEHYETLPKEVTEVLDKYCTGDNSYENCDKLIAELEPLGYTCDYGLDGEPYDLRRNNMIFIHLDLNWKVEQTPKQFLITHLESGVKYVGIKRKRDVYRHKRRYWVYWSSENKAHNDIKKIIPSYIVELIRTTKKLKNSE